MRLWIAGEEKYYVEVAQRLIEISPARRARRWCQLKSTEDVLDEVLVYMIWARSQILAAYFNKTDQYSIHIYICQQIS